MTMDIRWNRRGILMPPIHRHISTHKSYKIALRVAHRRSVALGTPMAIVAWHDDNFVVMPASVARPYDEADLFVEFIDSDTRIPAAGILSRLLSLFRR